MNAITRLLSLLQRLWAFLFASSRDEYLYNLDHAILHIQVPPPSLWMNLGYWKTETTLAGASQALLTQVLIAARLLSPDGRPTLHPSHRRLHLLDVGIGCGDQTLSLLQTQRLTHSSPTPGTETAAEPTLIHQPLFDSYTGVTIAPTQAATAQARVAALLKSESNDTTCTPLAEIHICCADAADPRSWPEVAHRRLGSPPPRETQGSGDGSGRANDSKGATWVLGLDTLYHFRPSRRAFLAYAAGELHASLMAFDLLLSPTASWWQRMLLRVICWVTATPVENFVTREEYEALLVGAGYALADIEVRDISGDVFAGQAGFLARREQELRPYGIGVGKFRSARLVFDWWAKSGVIRGVVVVARQ